MQAVKAEPYQPKTWLEEKQQELATLDRLVQNMKEWLQKRKSVAYTDTTVELLGETIITLHDTERKRAFLRSALKRVKALQEQIDFIQAHH
jgi:hypothetical protein